MLYAILRHQSIICGICDLFGYIFALNSTFSRLTYSYKTIVPANGRSTTFLVHLWPKFSIRWSSLPKISDMENGVNGSNDVLNYRWYIQSKLMINVGSGACDITVSVLNKAERYLIWKGCNIILNFIKKICVWRKASSWLSLWTITESGARLLQR